MLVKEDRINHTGHIEIVLSAFDDENGQFRIRFC